MSNTKEKHAGKIQYSPIMAVKEYVLKGHSITILEAIALFGVQSLQKEVTRMRKEGWSIQSRKVPMIVAVRRMNKYAKFEPPKELPITNIKVIEYWLSK